MQAIFVTLTLSYISMGQSISEGIRCYYSDDEWKKLDGQNDNHTTTCLEGKCYGAVG